MHIRNISYCFDELPSGRYRASRATLPPYPLAITSCTGVSRTNGPLPRYYYIFHIIIDIARHRHASLWLATYFRTAYVIQVAAWCHHFRLQATIRLLVWSIGQLPRSGAFRWVRGRFTPTVATLLASRYRRNAIVGAPRRVVQRRRRSRRTFKSRPYIISCSAHMARFAMHQQPMGMRL